MGGICGLKLRRPLATDEDRERRRWRRIVAYVLDDVVERAPELFDALWQHFADPAHWQLFDDVGPTWDVLTERGFHLGVASNFDERLKAICRRLPPLDRAHYQFCSAALGFPKPHRAYYRRIERQLGLAPHELLLVGDDQVRDHAAPQALGWQAVHVCRDGGPRLPESISSLAELPALLGPG
jgi:putative hydrolase of the HAD superfamily